MVGDALSRKVMTELRVLFARPSLFDDGSLLAELQVKPTWIEQIKGLLQPIKVPLWKWELVTIDLVSGLPLTPTKKDSVWLIVDPLTKSAHFIPTELGEQRVLGPELVFDTEDKVRLIRDRLKAASDRQKSYAHLKRREIEYSMGDSVFLKVLWHNHSSEEAMWEPEDAMRQQYPYLF
ncbi:uncharacterized protein LOC108459074 [Gossypium arboreum]|uniref:uncharacterized protein LOC108459074 n=1 Tax=Gossypium arboreum TaxID=29729 RepID=UPI000819096A|nr:uncharacterized protein LOC108459074 [Gossypium arboreum]